MSNFKKIVFQTIFFSSPQLEKYLFARQSSATHAIFFNGSQVIFNSVSITYTS